MIEKIPFKTEELCFNNKMQTVQVHASPYDLQVKINELVETVNVLIKENNIHEKQIDELQMKVEPEKTKDPYAEQRKWIGKVCRFWFNDINDTCLDYLDKIQTGENGIEYYGKETYDWFPHCEPVKPDDDIIFKGE